MMISLWLRHLHPMELGRVGSFWKCSYALHRTEPSLFHYMIQRPERSISHNQCIFLALSNQRYVYLLMRFLLFVGATHKSDVIISKTLDKAVDKANPASKNAAPGISIRHGPMVEMEIDEPVLNGTDVNGNASSKRKARNSTGQKKSYKDASDEEDDKPLVRQNHI